MSYDKIDLLLEKYFNGETSLQEEKELKEFFLTSEDIPEELVQLKNQFFALDEFASIELDNAFEQKILETISENDTENKTRLLTREEKPVRKHTFSYTWATIAASILILLSVWTSINHFQNKQILNQYNNPELAYQEVSNALSILAVNFDKGLSKTKQAAQPLNRGLYALGNIEKVGKGIESLKPVSKLKRMEIINNNKYH